MYILCFGLTASTPHEWEVNVGERINLSLSDLGKHPTYIGVSRSKLSGRCIYISIQLIYMHYYRVLFFIHNVKE